MNRNLVIVIGLIVALAVVPIVVIAVVSLGSQQSTTLTNTPPARSDDEIAQVIAKSNESLRDTTEKPSFKLLGKKRLNSNWYVAWVDDSSIRVLVNDPAVSVSMARVILGPASEFDEQDAISRGVPQAIYKEFMDAKL